MRNWLSILMLSWLFMACNEETEPFEERGSDINYYPLELGYYRTYLVDQIIYEISGFDTSRYYLRETVTDTLTTRGFINYLIRQDIAGDNNFDWSADSIFTSRFQDNQLIQSKGNIPLVKMVFPVQVGKTWDVNAFNTLERDEFAYADVDIMELEVNDSLLTGTDLIKVILEDLPINIVNQNQQWEVYGKEMGLIEKKSIILNFCTVNCDSARQIESGVFWSQKLIDYGYLEE